MWERKGILQHPIASVSIQQNRRNCCGLELQWQEKVCEPFGITWISVTPRKKSLLSKENIAACLKFAKAHLDVPQRYWKNILWTDETTVELFGRNTTLCVEKKRPSTPPANPHPNCKVWWRAHHGLGLLCYLRAWTVCYLRWKNEFPRLSRHFSGECKAICPPIEAQQQLGDATGQRPKTQK